MESGRINLKISKRLDERKGNRTKGILMMPSKDLKPSKTNSKGSMHRVSIQQRMIKTLKIQMSTMMKRKVMMLTRKKMQLLTLSISLRLVNLLQQKILSNL